MVRGAGGPGPGFGQEYREVVLGTVLGVLLALTAVVIHAVEPGLGGAALTISTVAFFAVGVGFGFVLWLASRRERGHQRIYQAIANTTSGGVVLTDKDGRIAFSNSTFCEMVGRPAAEVIGKRLEEVITADAPKLAEAGAVARGTGATSVFETALPSKQGPASTALVSVQNFGEGDKRLGSVVFLLDITARKRSEREVLQAKELAEFFLDLVAHDLANINHGARGYADLLTTDRDLAPQQRRTYAQRVLGQLDRAGNLIKNMRKVSELRWTAAARTSESVDLEETVRQAIASAMGSFAGRPVQVRFVNKAGPVRVRADYLATELFYNLIHNAIKYTAADRAEVEVEVQAVGPGSAVVRVSDHGQGIPDAAKVDVLSRIAPGKQREGPSGYHSGIGLTLVHLISERFGWKVWVENRVAGDYTQGSVFCVEVPPA